MMAAKAEEIRRVLFEPEVDLWKLRELALTEGGLVNGECRSISIVHLSIISWTCAKASVHFDAFYWGCNCV